MRERQMNKPLSTGEGDSCGTTFFWDVQPWKPAVYRISAWGYAEGTATYPDGSVREFDIGMRDSGLFVWRFGGGY